MASGGVTRTDVTLADVPTLLAEAISAAKAAEPTTVIEAMPEPKPEVTIIETPHKINVPSPLDPTLDTSINSVHDTVRWTLAEGIWKWLKTH